MLVKADHYTYGIHPDELGYGIKTWSEEGWNREIARDYGRKFEFVDFSKVSKVGEAYGLTKLIKNGREKVVLSLFKGGTRDKIDREGVYSHHIVINLDDYVKIGANPRLLKKHFIKDVEKYEKFVRDIKSKGKADVIQIKIDESWKYEVEDKIENYIKFRTTLKNVLAALLKEEKLELLCRGRDTDTLIKIVYALLDLLPRRQRVIQFSTLPVIKNKGEFGLILLTEGPFKSERKVIDIDKEMEFTKRDNIDKFVGYVIDRYFEKGSKALREDYNFYEELEKEYKDFKECASRFVDEKVNELGGASVSEDEEVNLKERLESVRENFGKEGKEKAGGGGGTRQPPSNGDLSKPSESSGKDKESRSNLRQRIKNWKNWFYTEGSGGAGGEGAGGAGGDGQPPSDEDTDIKVYKLRCKCDDLIKEVKSKLKKGDEQINNLIVELGYSSLDKFEYKIQDLIENDEYDKALQELEKFRKGLESLLKFSKIRRGLGKAVGVSKKAVVKTGKGIGKGGVKTGKAFGKGGVKTGKAFGKAGGKVYEGKPSENVEKYTKVILPFVAIAVGLIILILLPGLWIIGIPAIIIGSIYLLILIPEIEGFGFKQKMGVLFIIVGILVLYYTHSLYGLAIAALGGVFVLYKFIPEKGKIGKTGIAKIIELGITLILLVAGVPAFLSWSGITISWPLLAAFSALNTFLLFMLWSFKSGKSMKESLEKELLEEQIKKTKGETERGKKTKEKLKRGGKKTKEKLKRGGKKIKEKLKRGEGEGEGETENEEEGK